MTSPSSAACSERTSINIVVATGIYTFRDVPFYFLFRGANPQPGRPDAMTDLFVRDITSGLEQGFGWGDLSIVDGRRQSAADAYLIPVLHRPNLKVVTDALVHRVLMDGDRCRGVEYRAGTETLIAECTGEVVLAAVGALVLLGGAIAFLRPRPAERPAQIDSTPPKSENAGAVAVTPTTPPPEPIQSPKVAPAPDEIDHRRGHAVIGEAEAKRSFRINTREGDAGKCHLIDFVICGCRGQQQ